jgi:hypothetical protein
MEVVEDGKEYLQGPWFRFTDDYGTRHCQPDSVLVDKQKRRITIFEIKTRDLEQGYRQLEDVYRPVLAKAYPGYTIDTVLVCKAYSNFRRLVDKIELVDGISDAMRYRGDAVPVVEYDPSKPYTAYAI